MPSIEPDFWLELAQIETESISWIPLEEDVYKPCKLSLMKVLEVI